MAHQSGPFSTSTSRPARRRSPCEIEVRVELRVGEGALDGAAVCASSAQLGRKPAPPDGRAPQLGAHELTGTTVVVEIADAAKAAESLFDV